MFKPIILVIALVALLQVVSGAIPAPTSLTAESPLNSETTLTFKWDYPTENCTFEGNLVGDKNTVTFKTATKSTSFNALKKATYYVFAVSALCGVESSQQVTLSASTAITLNGPETVTFSVPDIVLTNTWPKGSSLDIFTHPSYCFINGISMIDKYTNTGTVTYANTISIVSLTASACRIKLPITSDVPAGTYTFNFMTDMKYNTGNEIAVQAILNLLSKDYSFLKTIPLPAIRGSLPNPPTTSSANLSVASFMIMALMGVLLMIVH